MKDYLIGGVIVLLWASKRFTGEVLSVVANRIGERISDWLLPRKQPSTFRVAFVIARLATVVAPRYQIRVGRRTPKRVMRRWIVRREVERALPVCYFRLDRRETATPSVEAEAAFSELCWVLQNDRTAVRPVRFVLPVLTYGARLRASNAAHAVLFAVCVTVAAAASALPGAMIGLVAVVSLATTFATMIIVPTVLVVGGPLVIAPIIVADVALRRSKARSSVASTKGTRVLKQFS